MSYMQFSQCSAREIQRIVNSGDRMGQIHTESAAGPAGNLRGGTKRAHISLLAACMAK